MGDSMRIKDPKKIMIAHLKRGDYQFTDHALIQMNRRDVITTEVVQALSCGEHTHRRDKWHEKLERWSYTFAGRTIDGKELVVWVSFVDQMLIVTVVNKTKDRESKRSKRKRKT